jgi:hypothetical protein
MVPTEADWDIVPSAPVSGPLRKGSPPGPRTSPDFESP